jgi:tripartite-type tricarboxylate transporter receptor subunit TctC
MALTLPAVAQQTVRLVVPFPVGGGNDRVARLLSPHLAEGLVRPVVVENRPGADGTIGANYVARAEPDGSMLLVSGNALATSTANTEMRFDPQRDLRPVIQLTTAPLFLVANADLGARTALDLRALAKQRPKGLNCGGMGGRALGCEHLRTALGGVETIPYQGMAPALKALLSGEVDLMFAPRDQLPALTASGRVLVLATVTDQPAAPPYDHVPLLKDAYPGLDFSNFTAVFVAAGTPDDVVQQYNREFNRILALPEVRAAIKLLDVFSVGGAPEVLRETLAHELKNYRHAKPAP